MEQDFVRAWRLNRSRYGTKTDAFSGKGAATYPGRWNEPGIPVVYTTSSVALAVLEILVHTHDRRVLNGRFSLFEVQIPAGLITDPVLPNDIGEITTTRQIGSQWIKKATHPALRVRSIITGEANYILNPNHPGFLKIEITDPQIFYFDQRLSQIAKESLRFKVLRTCWPVQTSTPSTSVFRRPSKNKLH